jgi:drug/metabolite transporter (DMT)-like permease
MKLRQVIGVLLIVVGLVSLLMGGERETIPLPPIVGGLLLAAGVILLVVRPKGA